MCIIKFAFTFHSNNFTIFVNRNNIPFGTNSFYRIITKINRISSFPTSLFPDNIVSCVSFYLFKILALVKNSVNLLLLLLDR